MNPDKIYSNLIERKISKGEAITQLMALIEESIDAEIRIRCLEIIANINIKNKKIFNLLETYLISDDNEFVRISAAKIIAFSFPKKAVKPLKWAIHHETSPLVLKTISKLFEGFEDIYFK
jgi:HEAT repeat protein